jgi:hypothetical protein
MSDESYLPKLMRPVTPENGYESPNEILARRHGYFSGSTDETHVDFPASPDASRVLEGIGNALEDKEAHATRKVAIRDRIGCYTWTWFTMVSCPKRNSISTELTSFKDNGLLG